MELLSRIRHRRTRALLSSYIDGEVSAAERRRVEAHAAGCAECSDEIESLRATVELVRALPELELPRSFELTRLPEEEPRVSLGVWAPRLATSVAGLLLVGLLAADFAGTLVQSGGFDEEAAEMQAAAAPPAPPAAMAQAAEAPAPQQPQAAAAPPMVAPTQPVQLMPSEPQAAPAPPAAPAAKARRSDPAARTPEAAAQTPAPAAQALLRTDAEPSPEFQAAAGEAEAKERSDAPAEPAADVTGLPGQPGAAAPEVWEPSDEGDGLRVSLRQLQVAAAVCFLALAAVTVWLARRRRV